MSGRNQEVKKGAKKPNSLWRQGIPAPGDLIPIRHGCFSRISLWAEVTEYQKKLFVQMCLAAV